MTLNHKEKAALLALRHAASALAKAHEALESARAACAAADLGSEVRAGLAQADEGHALAKGGLDYATQLIEGN